MWPIFKNLFISKISVQRLACWCIQNYNLAKISRGKNDVRSDLKDPVVLRSDFRQGRPATVARAHKQGYLQEYFHMHTAHTNTHRYICLCIKMLVAFTIHESQSKSVRLLPHCWKQERPSLREVGRLCCSLSTMTWTMTWLSVLCTVLKCSSDCEQKLEHRKEGWVFNSDLICNSFLCPRCPHWQ